MAAFAWEFQENLAIVPGKRTRTSKIPTKWSCVRNFATVDIEVGLSSPTLQASVAAVLVTSGAIPFTFPDGAGVGAAAVSGQVVVADGLF